MMQGSLWTARMQYVYLLFIYHGALYIYLLSFLFFFCRAQATTAKRSENVLLKRPPISRGSASQDGLSDMNSDPISRMKNPPSAVHTEGINNITYNV